LFDSQNHTGESKVAAAKSNSAVATKANKVTFIPSFARNDPHTVQLTFLLHLYDHYFILNLLFHMLKVLPQDKPEGVADDEWDA
jgi:hypothetical protein